MKLIVKDQVEQLNQYLDQEMVDYVRDNRLNKFESFDHFNLICFDWSNLLHNFVKPNQLIICIFQDEIFFICEDEIIQERLEDLLSGAEGSAVKILYTFFSQILLSDIEQIEDLEERITDMEDAMLQDNKTDCIGAIIAFRKELMALKRYYEQINQIIDGVLENENELISKEDIHLFNRLDKKVDRLMSNTMNLRDYVTQVREAYQAQIDIEQNNLMKIFTVVTTIFMPLTLIVGWYGMNLKIPEFQWKFGYLYVIILSVVVVGLLLVYFKKKKWF